MILVFLSFCVFTGTKLKKKKKNRLNVFNLSNTAFLKIFKFGFGGANCVYVFKDKTYFLIKSTHFLFCILFIKLYIFFQQKAWTLWNFIISFKIRIIGKLNTVLLPPKNWPADELFKLLKLNFWVSHFFSIITFN